MKTISQLPYIIKLIDDESPVVQEQVYKELKGLGPELKNILIRENIDLNPDQELKINQLMDEFYQDTILVRWEKIIVLDNNSHKVELGLGLVSDYLSRADGELNLHILLDELAEEYKKLYSDNSIFTLCHFLFSEKKIKGNIRDLHNPLNSNLYKVVERKQGNPLSLCMLFILVGERLNIKIHGCNLPGYFLALMNDSEFGEILVDCFNSGYILFEKEIKKLFEHPNTLNREEVIQSADALTILSQYLKDLIHSFHLGGVENEKAFIKKLLKILITQTNPNMFGKNIT
jgi:hypothetical protein